jgi:hypothetical protein
LGLTSAVIFSGNIEPEFTAEANVLLVGPRTQDSGDGQVAVNPVLVQPAALSTAAEVAALSANTAQVRSLLASEGYSTGYEVAAQRGNPILFIEVRAWSRDSATTTALRLVDLIEADLRLRQDAADAPDDQRVTTSVIGLSAIGGADYGGRTRARLALGGLAIGLAFGAAFLAEGIARRRHLRTSGDGDGRGRADGQPKDSVSDDPEPVGARN